MCVSRSCRQALLYQIHFGRVCDVDVLGNSTCFGKVPTDCACFQGNEEKWQHLGGKLGLWHQLSLRKYLDSQRLPFVSKTVTKRSLQYDRYNHFNLRRCVPNIGAGESILGCRWWVFQGDRPCLSFRGLSSSRGTASKDVSRMALTISRKYAKTYTLSLSKQNTHTSSPLSSPSSS